MRVTSLNNHPRSGGPLPSPHRFLGSRAARFATSVDSGYWKNSVPQQLEASIQATNRSVVLGFGKSERRVSGFTATRKKRPHKYVQAARSFLYNLSDSEEAAAFVETLRHITGFASGIATTPFRSPFCMGFGERRLLHQNPMERLEVVCENANYKTPDNRLFAANPEIRAAYWKKWRKQCAPVRKYRFVITRKDGGKERRLVVYPSAVKQFSEALLRLINSFWLYLQRHPEQVQRRYTGYQSRWQLHYPATMDWLALPNVREALAFKPEAALFTDPYLYEVDADRRSTLYQKRLLAYAEGSLRWRDQWQVSEQQAKLDLRTLRIAISAAQVRTLTQTAMMLALCTVLKKSRPTASYRKRAFPRPTNEQGYTTAPWSEHTRSRAPPSP